MGPSKFRAPLKANGQSSISFSSSSSLGSGNLDVKVGEQVPLQTHVVQPEHSKGVKCSGVKTPNKSVESNDAHALEPAKRKSSKNPVEPPRKKMKLDSASTSLKGSEVRGTNNLDDDKENICPKSKMQLDNKPPAKPCVSLTDKEYDCIFDAVLGCLQSDNSSDKADAKTKASLDHSKDLFDFSQSDLEDSEGEYSESIKKQKTVVEEKDDTPIINENLSSAVDTNLINQPDLNQKLGEQSVCDNTSPHVVTGPVDVNAEDDNELKINSVQSSSQESLANINVVDKSETQEADSQGSSALDFKNLHTSTPRVEKRTIGTTLASASQQSQLSDILTSPSTTLRAPASQSLQGVSSPLCTPKQPTLSEKLHSSGQGPITSACTPTSNVSITRKNSELLLQTPIRQSVAEILISTPITPSGSQQFSQELCLTLPPKDISAKDRLFWLQKKRLTGLWVQCGDKECQKWRYLEDSNDPTTLPDKWFCRMHPDEEFNNCGAPEKRLSLQAEEDMIFNKYSPGSLVWAKLTGFPWWPAMVDDDPDLEQFYWLNEFSDIPTWYHVVFFDDEKVPCCRAWIQVERLREFLEEPSDNESAELVGHKKRVKLAYKVACQAKLLGSEERLAQYSFASRYKGPIGGFFSKTYDGPIGFREPVSK